MLLTFVLSLAESESAHDEASSFGHHYMGSVSLPLPFSFSLSLSLFLFPFLMVFALTGCRPM